MDGSNCETAGDNVCDTPADPNLRQGSNCETYIVDRNCNYTGTLKDQADNLFAPDVRNIMSYSYDGCRNRFTPEQAARMIYFKDNFRDYLTCSASAAAQLSMRSEMNITPSTLVCNQPFTLTVDVQNEGDAAFVGEIVTAIYDNEGNFVSVIQSINITNGLGIGASLRLKFENVGIGFATGRYQIAIVSRNTGASDFQFVNPYVYQNPLFLNANCGSSSNCATPTGLVATPTYTNITLNWNVAQGATEYQTRIRPIGSTEWIESSRYSGTGAVWYGILPCQQYEFQVRAICGSNVGNYSSSIVVRSEGCNDVYCYASGDYEENWIQKIQLNTLINESGIDLGYANFTNRSTILEKGITYNMVLIPGTGGSNASMFWRVWIDFNQDNDFDDSGEQVIQRSTGNRTAVTAAFIVPSGALPGFTRMRVSMASDGFATSCQTNSLGEVEDYTVNIRGTGNTLFATPASLVFNELDQTARVQVKSNMAWTVVEGLNWVTVTAGEGIGNGSFDVRVSENGTGFSRSGTIQLVGNQGASVQAMEIIQNAAVLNCDIPTGLFASEVGYAYVILDWQAVPGATGYQTRIKRTDESTWTEGSIFTTPGITWGNTTPCATYEVQVLAICGSGRSQYSNSTFVSTDGCNDNRYCYSYGISWDDWIQRVQLNTLNNTSGNNFGYNNFTNLSTNLRKGQTVTLTLAPGRDGENKPVYWRAWIDYNQDGDFLDTNEQVAQITSNNTTTVTSSFLIPNSATNGATRMRVSMSIDELPASCETGGSKEVEDYTVVIEGGSTATLIVSPEQLNFTENGGVQQVGITATIPWSVSKSSADTWITSVSPSSGINNGIISVNVAPNQTSSPRSATLTVSGSGLSRRITITQAARIVTPLLVANPQQIEFSEAGGSRTINIEANVAWQVVGLPNWLTVNPNSGNGNGSLVVTATPNTTTSTRSGSFEIRGNGISAFITVIQNAPLPSICAAPTGLEAVSVGYAHIVLFWNDVEGATGYQTRYRINGGAWLVGSIYESTFISWGNRLPCTEYEYQVRAYCGDDQASDFSPSIFVTTEGCNDNFCYSYGLAWSDWIQRVQFNTLDNDSDFDFGYANFTDLSDTPLRTGQTYPIILTPGKDEESKLVYWRVWIDYNQNGDFGDPAEQVFEQIGSNEEPVAGNITIPAQVLQGVTRMRVSMSLEGFASPCATGNFREVEDYSVVIQTDNSFTVTPTFLNLDAGQNSRTLEIITNSSWSASTDRDWISLATTSGVGNQALDISVTNNPSTSAREGNILVNSNNNSISVTVRQEGASPLLNVVPDSITVNSSYNERTVIVTSNLAWTVLESASWLSITPNAGTNNGSFFITTEPNEGDTRTATVEVIGGSLTERIIVIQERSSSTGGSNWNIEPGGHNVSSEPGCVSFEVTSIFPWTATCTENCAWITSLSPQSGNRSRTVEVCYANNNSNQRRRAAITFSASRGTPSSTVYIEQAGIDGVAGSVGGSALQGQDFALQVYPNPTKETVFAQIFLPQAQTVKLVVADMSGKEIIHQIKQLEMGENTVSFEGLQAGIYVLQGIAENGMVERQLFVVSK